MATRSVFGGQAPPYKFPTGYGSAGQTLQTDGAGTLTWGAGGGGGSTFTDITVTGNILRTFSNVVQAPNTTSAVTINTPCGLITTAAYAALAAGTTESFTVNNSTIETSDLVLVTVQDQSVTAGSYPAVNVSTVVDGSFLISVQNVGTVAMTGDIDIGYEIIKHT